MKASNEIYREATENRTHFVLGANGEIIFPSDTPASVMWGAVQNYTEKDGHLLMWAPFHFQLAEVLRSGRVVVLRRTFRVEMPYVSEGMLEQKTMHVWPGLFAEFPTRWPFFTNGVPAPAPPGTVLCRSLEENAPAPPPPPGALQWLMLGSSGELIAPAENTAMPANVLWVVPSAQPGELDLIHSGPLHSGLYAHVCSDGKMLYGERRRADPPLYAIAREFSLAAPGGIWRYPSHWPFFTDLDHSALACIPPGCGVEPVGLAPDDVTVVVGADGKVTVHPKKITVE
ncbi:MAG: hypothetical protein GXY15_13265 [Candidatus Hydrogenedentes bacterium]|nr:hypothetical protein [Candidatus Hydrogenedentota bacterium]